jgi:hypothetical protein
MATTLSHFLGYRHPTWLDFIFTDILLLMYMAYIGPIIIPGLS